ncbi:MAG TPA: hypothetical protein VEQ67_10370, partial [Mycobacterium sp.]|nr:hypothetical protein [Mycobacterium sp.]
HETTCLTAGQRSDMTPSLRTAHLREGCKFSNLVSLAHFRVISGVILAKYVEGLALISSDAV